MPGQRIPQYRDTRSQGFPAPGFCRVLSGRHFCAEGRTDRLWSGAICPCDPTRPVAAARGNPTHDLSCGDRTRRLADGPQCTGRINRWARLDESYTIDAGLVGPTGNDTEIRVLTNRGETSRRIQALLTRIAVTPKFIAVLGLVLNSNRSPEDGFVAALVHSAGQLTL